MVSQPTVSRLLKRRNWTGKELRRISLNRSEALRRAYQDDIRHFAVEDLIFLNESIFNKKTGWRYHAYALLVKNHHMKLISVEAKTGSSVLL